MSGSDHVEPLLDYGCSPWRMSSQRAADLYDSGVKLWRKEDLVEIEQQLAQSCTTEKFTVRRIDGSVVNIKNPMFGVQKPIWKPRVVFQEYWRLVYSQPDAPPETYSCTYLLDWINLTARNYEGPIENVQALFKSSQQKWEASESCEAFTSQFRKILSGDGNSRKVTKVVCFGLGDMNAKLPDWWMEQNHSRPEHERTSEMSEIEGPLIHHAIAMTMAEIVRSCAKTEDGGSAVRLLTQDPAYSDETKDLVRQIGFEVVGEHGAGGFAELDDESVVFSPFAAAPVRQIIADLARPVAIILAGGPGESVFNKSRKPYYDPESPRTAQMWKGYESREFPVSSGGAKLEGSLHQLVIHARIEEQP
ncbi:hypothetical protein F4777DRAFT_579674 [Nemania sp. FL0916]|nr:hypothetical protein F4777DRAFT_579674 [Nemania sp. FL0916]